jgi:hypothetical protein
MSAQPSTLVRGPAGPANADSTPLSASAAATSQGITATPSGSGAATLAVQHSGPAKGTYCCRRKPAGLLAVADSHGVLHSLCPHCGAVAWAGADVLKPRLTATPGHGSGTDPVAGLGADAMSSAPCWIRDVIGPHPREPSATHDFDASRQLLAWCTNSGVVGLSSAGCCEMAALRPDCASQPASELTALGTMASHNAGLGMSTEQPRQDFWGQKPGLEPPSQQEAAALRSAPSSIRAARLAEVGCRGTVQMPAATYSAPVAFGQCVVLGCRDDHLYCLAWQ